MNHLLKGYNALCGLPLYDGGQSYADIFSFTYDNGQATSGDASYTVPDQAYIPTVNFVCDASSRTSEVTSSFSMESMEAYASSTSSSYSASAEASGFGFSASVSAAYSSSRSSAAK